MELRKLFKTLLASTSSGVIATTLGLTLASTQTIAATMERVSIGNDGSQANEAHIRRNSAISTDGRYVVFSAEGLTPGATYSNVYLRDRTTNTTELVSISSSGAYRNESSSTNSAGVNADGRYITFTASLLDGIVGSLDVYVRDRTTGTTELISTPGQAGRNSQDTSISDNGRYVIFSSNAATLVSGDTNGVSDIFVRDRVTGTTERVSVASNGTEANGVSQSTSISGDGRYVAFTSGADNLVPNDTNGVADLFLHDRATGTTKRVNVANDGTQSSSPISGSNGFKLSSDGHYTTFTSNDSLSTEDTNSSTDIYVYDQVNDTVELISRAYDGSSTNGLSLAPSISANGRYVSFATIASNIVEGGIPNFLGIIINDRLTQTSEMVDVPDDGVSIANGYSFGYSGLSGDGRHIAFTSLASNLVTGDLDTNSNWDVFVYDRLGGICP